MGDQTGRDQVKKPPGLFSTIATLMPHEVRHAAPDLSIWIHFLPVIPGLTSSRIDLPITGLSPSTSPHRRLCRWCSWKPEDPGAGPHQIPNYTWSPAQGSPCLIFQKLSEELGYSVDLPWESQGTYAGPMEGLQCDTCPGNDSGDSMTQLPQNLTSLLRGLVGWTHDGRGRNAPVTLAHLSSSSFMVTTHPDSNQTWKRVPKATENPASQDSLDRKESHWKSPLL